jgi:hypothetical protein
MSFLNPFFLIALLTVAVPLLIYLINLHKPKKIRFSTLAFFDVLQTKALRRIKIKRWLLLAVRMLAVVALVIAAARPFLPPGMGASPASQDRVIGILIDNAPAMDRMDESGPFIEQALGLAARVIELAGQNDKIILEVTHGEALNLPPLSQQAAQNRLDELSTVSGGNYTKNRLYQLSEEVKNAAEAVKLVYIITDGQDTQFSDFGVDDPDAGTGLFSEVLLVGNGNVSNTAITGVSIDESGIMPGEPVTLRAEVTNFGNAEIRNQFVSLEKDGSLIAQHVLNMAAGESREFVFEVMPDEENVAATLLLEGDEIVFDNRRYVSVRLPSARSILLIRDEQSSNASLRSYLMPLLEAAAETDTKIEVEQRLISNTDFSDLPEYDAIVLDGLRRIPEFAVPEILNFVQQGGGLLFIPAADGDMTGYNRFLGNLNMGRFADVRGSYGSFQAVDRLGTIREGHPVINDLFDLESDDQIRINTPELFYYYRFDAGGNPRIFTILQTQAGHPVLTEQEVGNGNVMVLSLGTDPGWSNFPVKPIFAPIFYRTVLYLASGDQGGIQEHILGESFTTTIDGNPEQIALTLNDERVIPERRQTHSGLQIDYDGIEWQPGFLTIEADDKQYTFAVNLNAMESNPVTLSETELKAVLEVHTEGVRVNRVQGSETEMENVIQSASFGKEIWYWFIIAAFVLLVTESIISRMYKAESIQ